MVELMVSVTIGLFVVAAMFLAYSNSGGTSRQANIVIRMSEDAALAFNVLRQQVSLAGFSMPVGVNAGQTALTKRFNSRGVFGCDGAFEDMDADIDTLACDEAAGAAPDSLAVAFEADAFNSVLTADGSPVDCIGNGIPLVPGADYWVSYSRFYVSNGTLFCRGSGNAGGQALIDNVQEVSYQFGVAKAGEHRASYYDTAGNLDAAAWSRVVTVRVCLVLRSAEPILEGVSVANPNTYQGCDPFADPVDMGAADRRLYRAFTSTIAVNNRLLRQPS
ncbi:hypothetical protein G3A44_11070 [Ideonella sp. TBM-1]|uniref:Pilus assembly protein PilW n=1 Tax=Ideonella livida TaxID=2707176 RepID=A0A7C9TLP2_9BURK|nr:hypothetical protein [Ideonella livida]